MGHLKNLKVKNIRKNYIFETTWTWRKTFWKVGSRIVQSQQSEWTIRMSKQVHNHKVSENKYKIQIRLNR